MREAAAADPGLVAVGPGWANCSRRSWTAWGQRGTARGAVVVIASDGWERGDATLLGEQASRLRRLAHRCLGQPARRAGRLRAGHRRDAAALPHVDELVAGHSLAALPNWPDCSKAMTYRPPAGATVARHPTSVGAVEVAAVHA